MGLLMDDIARRSYDADRASFLRPIYIGPTSRDRHSDRPRADRPKAEVGEAATATSGVAEAEVAAEVAGRLRAIHHGRERREPVDADHADVIFNITWL